MRIRTGSLAVMIASLAVAAACNSNQSPDEIRRKTAEETATAKRDTQAVAEGIKEGLHADHKTIDLNKASKDDLMALPGITEERADRIIAARPYASVQQLVTRHVVPEDEYAKIQDRVSAGQ